MWKTTPMNPIVRLLALATLCGPRLIAQPADPASLTKEGVALDLGGHYAEARAKLSSALAQSPDSTKDRALRNLAVSYAFTCDRANVGRFEHQVIDGRLSAKDPIGAADVDNEL